MSRVKSALGLHPDTLISTDRGEGCIIFLFQGEDPNTHWELFAYVQAWMWSSLLLQTQPVPPRIAGVSKYQLIKRASGREV